MLRGLTALPMEQAEMRVTFQLESAPNWSLAMPPPLRIYLRCAPTAITTACPRLTFAEDPGV